MTDIPSYIDWCVGMKVVCVVTLTHNRLDYREERFPQNGTVYTIREIDPDQYGAWVRLVEIINPMMEYTGVGTSEKKFSVKHFRPVQTKKTSIEIFNRILLNPRIRISEDA